MSLVHGGMGYGNCFYQSCHIHMHNVQTYKAKCTYVHVRKDMSCSQLYRHNARAESCYTYPGVVIPRRLSLSLGQVLKLRGDIVRATSDASMCNSLFELGCLLSLATPDSFGSGMSVCMYVYVWQTCSLKRRGKQGGRNARFIEGQKAPAFWRSPFIFFLLF